MKAVLILAFCILLNHSCFSQNDLPIDTVCKVTLANYSKGIISLQQLLKTPRIGLIDSKPGDSIIERQVVIVANGNVYQRPLKENFIPEEALKVIKEADSKLPLKVWIEKLIVLRKEGGKIKIKSQGFEIK